MYTYVYIETNLAKPFQNFTGCARLLADSITVSEVNYIYELTFFISPKKTNVLSSTRKPKQMQTLESNHRFNVS